MAPTRMKLRVRRRDNAAGGAGAGAGGGQPEEGERGRESGGRSSRRKNTNNTTTTAAATSSSSPPTSSASASAWAVMAAEEASPDSKCPICLDRFNNLAYLDRCLHRFCFPCIQEWSHNKAECPLCKQPFTSILHSVRAEDDFKEYTLRPAPADSSVAATVAMVAAMASAARNDHQMRLTLRRHRADDGGETTTRRRRRERGGRGGASRRAGERTGVWEWYLDSHPLPHLPHHSTVSPIITEDSDESEGVVQQRIREAADLEERGVIFEGLTGLGGAVTPVTPSDRASRQLMTRLAARQRLQREGGTVRRLRDREMVAFRRALYRCGIRVHGVAGVSGNQGQQQNDVSAESFRRNPAHLNRLRPWLRRELTVLYGAHGVLVDIVQRIIMARLARHGLEDTPTIEEELRPFLLARTDHFLHELVSFARSPLSLDGYDMQAVYEPLTAALELDGISSSSDSSSVIAISEGEEEERQEEGRPEERLQGSAHDNISQSGSCLSLTGWDDETPGPSYSTTEPSCSLASLPFSPAMQDAANEEREEKREEDGEEECQIVGYKKPIAERTPELVQLSSDTENDDEEKKKKKVEEKVVEELPLLPPTSTPPSGLPTIPPSTSGTYREEQDDRLKEKDGEEGGRRSNACSWLGTSGRSQESVFTLSPSERQRESWRDRKQSSNEVAREKRKRRRRGQDRSGDWRKSGTLYNPNRSIYPAMMRHRSRSPSPFHSSGDSGPLSPPDSNWEYHGSPLSSSVSSHSSSSPLCSSPQPSPPPQTPPTPSLSPSNPHHGEKPGGKRKYKSRHLDSTDKDPTWRPSSSSHHREKKRKRGEKERRRRGRDGGRRRERHRRDTHRESVDYGGESSRRCREDRSPSVEIIYEGTITSNAVQPPSRKRHRKRHRKTQHSSSPVIITLDSDSSHDDLHRNVNSSSSSPLSSQQTVDFSDLPPLPLVHSAGVGGVLDAEISELPVDILDRGSDGSETEPIGRSKAAGPIAIDNSDHEVDVVNTDESGLLLGCDEADKELSSDTSEPIGEAGTKPLTAERQRQAVTADCSSQPTGENVVMVDVHKNDSDDFTSDSRLLETILNDLKGTAAPNCDLPLNFEHSSPDTRKKHCRNQDSWLAETRHLNPSLPEERWSNDFRNQNQGLDSPTCRTNIPKLPPLEQLKDGRVKEEGRDVPPVLKQDSPVQSHDRNKPPPLKHTDAGSVHLPPSSPVDLHSPYASHLNSNPTISPADSHSAAELSKDNKPIPPISTLKRHFTSTLALRGMMPPTSEVSPHGMESFCHIAPTDSHRKAGAVTNTLHSTSPVSPIDSHSSSVSKNSFTSSDRFSSFHSAGLNSDSATKEKSSGPRSSSSELLPLNPLPSIDFHSSRTGWSTEKAAHSDSTSRGCRNKTLGPNACSAVPSDLHPGSSVSAQGTPAGSFLFSGVGSNDTLPPVPVPPVDPRTQNPHSPIDSQFSNKRAPLSEKHGVSSTTAPSSRSSPTDTHPVGPFDHHPSSAAEELRNSNVPSPVNHENRTLHPPPIDLYCSPAPPVHLHSSGFTNTSVHSHFNHTAISSPHTIAFHTSHRQCSAQAKPNTGSNSKRLCSTDSEPHNHFDRSSAPPFPVDTYSKRSLPMDSQCGSQALVDFHPKNSREDFQLHMDNHIRSSPRPVENQWKSTSSTEARSDSRSPVDEQSAGSMWTTHALSQRTQK
ncbi:uncharacterized protein LOC113138886 isoform X2 [Mastacembelus armatus]|uniref:uncharacterized protein LOC113138886 isoform X2 n=1 Tax=Mastacembelus armatus TaxID=205130 RepID=UPI000E463BA5|nr:uncharacterized protein LOC113138886 isoform X2 [Mastacembelus armatus]